MRPRLLPVAIVLSMALSGCGLQHFLRAPNPAVPHRQHPLGMLVYDEAEKVVEETEWAWRFGIIGDAYSTFKACINPEDPEIDRALRNVPIIILPPEPIIILGQDTHAFTNLRTMFLRSDFFHRPELRHEWIHIYLFVTGKRFLGDLLHRDQRFKSCWRIPDND